MEEDIIKLYDPKNARNLSQEQVNEMQNLNNNQIEELANAYPNQPFGGAYLILKDTKLDKSKKPQSGFPSTWANFRNLRIMHKGDNYVAWTFRELWAGANNNTIVESPIKRIPVARVQDLTDSDINTAAGVVKEHFEEKEKEKKPKKDKSEPQQY